MNPSSDLPQRIRRYRRNLGENQTEFGARFGVTRLAVGGWESGTLPNSIHLPQIMELLNAAEAQPGMESAHQFSLPFEQPIELSVKMSPQASRTIHFELRVKANAS